MATKARIADSLNRIVAPSASDVAELDRIASDLDGIALQPALGAAQPNYAVTIARIADSLNRIVAPSASDVAELNRIASDLDGIAPPRSLFQKMSGPLGGALGKGTRWVVTSIKNLWSAFGLWFWLILVLAAAISYFAAINLKPRGIWVVAAVIPISALLLTFAATKTPGGRSFILTGADGRASTSKLQFWLWTGVVLYAYGAVYLTRLALDALPGETNVPTDVGPIGIPQNLLLATGFSVITLVGAKAIATSYVQQGRTTQTKDNKFFVYQFIQDDAGNVDLSKVQALAWTAIAIVTFLIGVIRELNGDLAMKAPFCKETKTGSDTKPCQPPTLPDIDGALMVLMGLAQGTYLGGKLVAKTSMQLDTVTPETDRPPVDTITLTGKNFGDEIAGSCILLTPVGSVAPVSVPVKSWKDEQIVFAYPASPASLCVPRQPVSIQVSTGAAQSNARAFTPT